MKTKGVARKEDAREAWDGFLKEIAEARVKLRCGESEKAEAWFRGHRSKAYDLEPSLFRYFKSLPEKKREEVLWEKESDLFWEFWARAKELQGVIEDDWDILFAMQHYGAPTRLLDWTESLAVAVYFAILNLDENDESSPNPCVWVLNPYLLNGACSGVQENEEVSEDLYAPKMLGWCKEEEDYYTYSELLLEGWIGWDSPLAIYPKQRNPRIHAQRAWFTIHGDELTALNKQKWNDSYLKMVELPKAAIPAAREFLKLSGTDHYLLFADLESLSLLLQEKNGLLSRSQIEEKVQQRLDRRYGRQ